MKKIFSALAVLLLSAICQYAYAAPAVVSGLKGSAQAVPIAGSTRTLKDGDSVNEGDNVTTDDNSSLVLRFEDGQIVAMGAKSRMAITTYKYDAKEPAKGSVFLSLVTGSMRAITGLIGKASPQRVAYKAGNATMGIRGTDVEFATVDGKVVMQVLNGEVSFTFNGKTVSVPGGEGVLAKDGSFTKDTIAAINKAVEKDPALAKALKSVTSSGVDAAVNDAKIKADKAAAELKDAKDKADAAKTAADKAAAAAALAAAEKAAADAKAAQALAEAAKAAADARAAAAAQAALDAKGTTGAPAPGPSTGAGTGAGGSGTGGGGAFQPPASGK